MTETSNHLTVTCLRCELRQFADRAICRRCEKPLHDASEIIVRADVRVPEQSALQAQVDALIEQVLDRLNAEVLRTLRPMLCAEIRDVELMGQAGVIFGHVLPKLEELEAQLIREALRRHGTALRAAKAIGIGKTTLYRKLRASEPPVQTQTAEAAEVNHV